MSHGNPFFSQPLPPREGADLFEWADFYFRGLESVVQATPNWCRAQLYYALPAEDDLKKDCDELEKIRNFPREGGSRWSNEDLQEMERTLRVLQNAKYRLPSAQYGSRDKEVRARRARFQEDAKKAQASLQTQKRRVEGVSRMLMPLKQELSTLRTELKFFRDLASENETLDNLPTLKMKLRPQNLALPLTSAPTRSESGRKWPPLRQLPDRHFRRG
ncbi:hypothetical protein T439DRAFT_371204 [Meredithblackwellia eburnea MCA 4105]